MNMISPITAICIWTLFYLSMMSVIDGENFSRGELKYDRINEVNKECSFVLDSATELQRDDNRLHTIKEELSFENGDWWQDLDAAPLMPFDDSQIPETDTRSPLKLVSFRVTDVNSRYRSNKAIYISSFLRMGITLWNTFSAKTYGEKPKFSIRHRQSQLSVSFQGIYAESEENHGERVMCLLGTTFWPSSQLHSSLDEPLLAKDDQILLVLRFPRKLTLRSRTIRGIMKSMNSKSNLRYFDEVHISSWLSNSVNYKFASETLVSKACEAYPFKDSFVNGDTDLYKGLNFCVLLKRFTQKEAFTILPNWKCNGTGDNCSKIGPFELDKEINTRDFKILLQDVRCDKMTFQDDNNIGTMKIYLVLRAIPPYEDQFTAVRRTGVSNFTIFAEGIWKSSSGQLCMVGCKGDSNECDTRICLYLPLSFSLNQQTLILGTLSSTDHTSISPFHPLPFERQARAAMSSQAMFWDQYIHPRPTYEYSKIDDARVVLEKDNPLSLDNAVKKCLLGFPKIMDLQQFPYSLSVLANDLTFPNLFISESDVALEINFLGPLFGRCFSRQNISSFAKENHYYFDMDRYTDKHLLLNVSGQLNYVPNIHTNLSFLSVEGIYDPLVGKMYLIGCEDSLDCLVEVVISYPPTTARWLFKPKAWISINSKRKRDDPFYFQPIKLQTGPLTYNQEIEGTLSRRGLERIISILTLSLGITCILSQILYIRESTPYVSLVMLGVQALGYSLPLITGAQVIFRKVESDSYWQTSQWIRISDYVLKLLVLAAFLLTMRLFHKVMKSRIRMIRRTPLEPECVPNEKKLCLATLVVHIIGCIHYLSVQFAKSTSESPQSAPFHESGTESYMKLQLVGEVEQYLVLVQDLFLVPQIFANLLWKIDCKPLRRFYYVGMTFVRLVPRIYYLVKPSYFPEPHAIFRPQFDFFSMVGDVAMAVTVVFLGFVVYVQQRWSYKTLREVLIGGSSKFKSV